MGSSRQLHEGVGQGNAGMTSCWSPAGVLFLERFALHPLSTSTLLDGYTLHAHIVEQIAQEKVSLFAMQSSINIGSTKLQLTRRIDRGDERVIEWTRGKVPNLVLVAEQTLTRH